MKTAIGIDVRNRAQSYITHLTTLGLIGLFCLASFSGLKAQDVVIFSDEFIDNKNNWNIGSYTNYNTEIADGKLVFTSKNSAYAQYVFKEIYINPDGDFTIGTKFRVTEDLNSHYSGLVWGLRDNYSSQFLISSNGFVSITHRTNKGVTTEVNNLPCEHIKPLGEYNTIAIGKKGNKVFYFINGKVVHEGFFNKISGIGHGLFLGAKQVEIENFTIRHPPIQIVVAGSPIKTDKRENLGANVNSYCGEISPKISSDGKTLFVCRAGHKENVGGPAYDQDAWFATRNPDDTWSPIQNMGRPVNDAQQNAVASVSTDQNVVLLNYDGRDDPGLMRSVRTSSGWSTPERVQIDDFYNDNFDAEFALSPDGKAMVYSVERRDSHGEKDLYVSFLKPDGSWTAPKNLGPTVNTFTTDFGPFIAADGRTLYFGSMGHPGYGSSDIFVTKRLDDTWTNWSPPKNLGPQVNGKDWDAYYTITASGEEAYMSTAGEYGNTDIFRFKYTPPKDAAPDPVVLIKGRVLDQKTKKPMSATIAYEDLSTGKEIGIARTNPRTGEYQIALPYGKDYGFQASAKGHISISEHIDLSVKGLYKELVKDLYLAPIEIGETVVMQNLFFERASAKILPSSVPELERVVKLLKENPSLSIKIKGHTDNLGPAERLMKLSTERAQAVRRYLIEHGIDPARLTEQGFGGAQAIAGNDTEQERALNRRVEFEIIKY